jgi:hypothetical protein
MTMVKPFSWFSGLTSLGLVIAGCSGTDDGLPGNVSGTSNGGSAPSAASSGSMSGGMPSQAGAAGGGTSGSGSTTGGNASGGSNAAGAASGGTGSGGTPNGGSTTGGSGGAGGAGMAGASGSAGSGTGGGGNNGPCTPSRAATAKGSGSGSHMVTIETNSDPGIKEGTIFRPADLGAGKKYPIFVWGEGGCSKDGLSNQAAMAEIASHGYFVIADGTPGGSGNRTQSNDVVAMGKPLLAYIDWAIAENGKSCSAYYQSLDTTKVAANGFSCGGLMAEGTAGDPRMTTWGLNSSGMISANPNFYKLIHTPVLLVEGGTSDIAFENGKRDYDNISQLTVPLMWFSKNIGHGGDLFSNRGGDFTKINLAWLNWWLKDDQGATGKGVLVGAGCKYCTDSAWEVKSAHLP